MEIEHKALKNKNYFQRFKSEFFPSVAVVAILSLIGYKMTNLNFIIFLIIGYSIIWGIVTHFMVRKSINRILINEGNILIEGTEINTEWSKSNKIENTSVKIKSQGFGRGNVEYYLKIYFSDYTHIINKRKEWDYNDLIKIYNHISKDKLNPENKDLLEKMKLKAKGYSSFEITFGKNNK